MRGRIGVWTRVKRWWQNVTTWWNECWDEYSKAQNRIDPIIMRRMDEMKQQNTDGW